MSAIELYFMWQTGCPYCARTKPHVTRFTQKHPEVKVTSIDISTISDWPEGRWAPKAIPAFLLIRPGETPRTISGEKNITQLEKWVGVAE